jgi:hypothetical protein
VIKDVGTFFEENAEAVEEHITAAEPLSDDGDVLAVSWDGVMVATRNTSGSTAWREAGVATISIYDRPDDDSPEPDRIDARYFARMPESGMTTLIAQVEGVRGTIPNSRGRFTGCGRQIAPGGRRWANSTSAGAENPAPRDRRGGV